MASTFYIINSYHTLGCISVDQTCKIEAGGENIKRCRGCKTWQSCADWCFLSNDACKYWRFSFPSSTSSSECIGYTKCEVQPTGTTNGNVIMGDRDCHSLEVGCQIISKECKGQKISTSAITVFPGGWKRCASACYYTENCNYWQVRPKPKETNQYECDLFRRCRSINKRKSYILGVKSCNGIGKYNANFNLYDIAHNWNIVELYAKVK